MTDMAAPNGFDPDYAFPPGSTLLEWLEESDMSQSELARRLARSEKFVSELINGKAPLSRRVALDLESVTGIPAKIWNRLEVNYRDTLEGLQREDPTLDADAESWLDQIPTPWLRKGGFVTATKRHPKRLYEQTLAFFQVASPDAWHRTWSMEPVAAFRTSRTFTSDSAAVATWLQAGRLLAARTHVPPYDPVELKDRIEELRALTLEQDLVAALTKKAAGLLAESGVVLVFSPTPPRVACSAATQWHAGHPMILMSLRYNSDDHIWFSLFHEIGHLLLDPNMDTLEGGRAVGQEDSEARADAFASDVLIPRDQATRLPEIKTLGAAKAFAEEIGIAPGVVVGRLQYEGHWSYHTGNGLKRRVRWTD